MGWGCESSVVKGKQRECGISGEIWTAVKAWTTWRTEAHAWAVHNKVTQLLPTSCWSFLRRPLKRDILAVPVVHFAQAVVELQH